MTSIPTPNEVIKRIREGSEADGQKLIDACVARLQVTTVNPTVVSIPANTSEAGVAFATQKLVAAGWQVERYRGCQRDQCDDLRILAK
jgi:hypothetical protein